MSVTIADYGVYGSQCMPAYDGAATLNGALTSSATTAPFNVPTSALPSSGEFAVAFSSGEIAWATQGAPAGGVSSGTLTIIRGFAGTAQAAQVSSTAITMPIGGPVDFTTKIFFTDVSSGNAVNYVGSSSGDTLIKILVTGRDSTGTIQQETKTLNGTTIVAGTQAWGRLEDVKLAAVVSSNVAITASSLTITTTASSVLPSSISSYVQMAKEIIQVSASSAVTSSWTIVRAQLGTTATIHQSGDPVYLLPLGDVAVYDSTAIAAAHSSQSGSANATGVTPPLMHLSSGDGALTSLGMLIVISSGTGSGQIRTIIASYASSAYGADFVAVSRNWGTIPDTTSAYSIFNGVQLDLSPNQITECRRFTWNAAAPVAGASSSLIFYQKFFAVNNNTVTALTSVQFEISSNIPALPGSSLLDMSIASSLNDTAISVSRQSSLSSAYGAFVTQPSYISMTANSGTLPVSSGAANSSGAQGLQLRLTLPAGTAAYKGSAVFQTQGTTV